MTRALVVVALFWLACTASSQPIQHVAFLAATPGGGASVYGYYDMVTGCDENHSSTDLRIDVDGNGKMTGRAVDNMAATHQRPGSVYFPDGTKILLPAVGETPATARHTDAAGTQVIWSVDLPFSEINDAVLADDGTVLIGGEDNAHFAPTLLKLKEDGTVVWQVPVS